MRQPRNFRNEYQARKTKGLAAGKSLSAARGHPKASDLPRPTGPVDRRAALEKALLRMKRGESQKTAAAAEGVTVEKLRVYRNLHTTSVRQGAKWTIFDTRPTPFWTINKGEMKSIILARDEGSEVGRYWIGVNRFLNTNNASHLAPFVGRGVRDINGRFFEFEVRPNTLRRLDQADDLHFLEIYADADVDGGDNG